MLSVTSHQEMLTDRAVTRLGKFLVVQCEVHVIAADVLCARRGQQELRHPSTDNHDTVTVFAQNPRHLKHDLARSLNCIGRIINPRSYHVGLITWSRMAS